MRAYFTLCAGILANMLCVSRAFSQDHCATMPRLDSLFEKNISLKKDFEAQRNSFNTRLQQRKSISQRSNAEEITYTVPVVFHIVLPDPTVVKDAQLQAQLEVLNRAFSGTNADSTSIPSWFKPLFAKSYIRFCLAQRTPDDAPSTGITRTTTNSTSFTYDDKVKYSSSGGDDSWNTDDYFNVWICRLGGDVLGYATFPDDGDATAQGVVIDYRTLPEGGTYQNYNTGKTLCHETGHYFNLYHIWGDDDGACTGTDYVDDTPNQANASTGCNSGVKTDRCTPGGNGILYQNYMDYSYDNCLTMFTIEQAERMEYALTTYRASLLNSQGCTPVDLYPYDAALTAVYEPAQRLCSSSFSPLITIRNKGTETLTSLDINVLLNNEWIGTYKWSGNLSSWDTMAITLPQYNIDEGRYTLTVRLTDPNGQEDNDTTNNTLSAPLLYYPSTTAIQESFEGESSLPAGWDMISSNNTAAWQKTGGIASAGITSMMKQTDTYGNGEKAWLRMPGIQVTNVDSAYLTFMVAAAPVSQGSARYADTLEVLLSQDCGKSYQSLYKRYNASLITSSTVASAFNPSGAEWQKDTVSLLNYIDKGDIMLAFRVTNYNQTNIYIDEVNVFTVTVNPNLKAKGFMATPNPTSGKIYVQFYPTPDKLLAVQIYSIAGQLIKNIATGNGPSNLYTIDLSAQPAGVYIIRAVFSDQVLIKKIIRN